MIFQVKDKILMELLKFNRIKEIYVYMLTLRIKGTYSHVLKSVKELGKENYVILTKVGRCLLIELTGKGISRATELNEVFFNDSKSKYKI